MVRRIVPLTPDRLAALPGPCRSCVAWELHPATAARLGQDALARESEKLAWTTSVLRDWGSCGRVALIEDRPVGYVVYAPAALVPGADRFATAPISPDAVLLTTIYVAAPYDGAGLGRMLVQHLARDLITRGGYRAVEAFADPTGRSACRAPADFLARVGFRTQRAHPREPRLRMDLRSALTWRDEVEAALERLRGAVRPTPVPETPRLSRGSRRAP